MKWTSKVLEEALCEILMAEYIFFLPPKQQYRSNSGDEMIKLSVKPPNHWQHPNLSSYNKQTHEYTIVCCTLHHKLCAWSSRQTSCTCQQQKERNG